VGDKHFAKGIAVMNYPEKKVSSPLEVPSINAKITSHEIVDIVREGRER
jgi:hypothetical protein